MKCPQCCADNQEGAENCFHCGRGLFSLTDGARLNGRYEVLKPLGKGGMGVVYLAHDHELDEKVAVKVLRAELARSPDVARRFRSEIKLARKVRHRNVCGIHEYGQDGHLQYIVMEYIQGTDLKQLIRQGGPLPPAQAFETAMQIAKGLHAIHDAGIVHRDLKTPNIMRNAEGVIRLMDFGIAKQYEDTSGATATGHVIGTPEYMSPEQASAQRLDPRSDLYALGIVIWELFTGMVPFHGDTPVATMLMHIREPLPLDGHEGRMLPTAMKPVLAKALAKDRDDRYLSARNMLDALRQARDLTLPPLPPALRTPSRVALAVEAVADTDSFSTPVPTPMATPVAPAVTERIRQEAAVASRTVRPGTTARVAGSFDLDRAPTGAGTSGHRGPHAWQRSGVILGGTGAMFAVAMFASLWKGPFSGPPRNMPSPATTPVPSPAAPAIAGSPGSEPTPTVPTSGPVTIEPSVRPLPTQGADGARPSTAMRVATLSPRLASPSPEERLNSDPTALPPSSAATGAEVAVTPGVGVFPRPESPSPAAAAQSPLEDGTLKLVVLPWAEVTVDGRSVGTTPLKPIILRPGVHTVVLNNPGFQPLNKKVTIRGGAATTLEVDLTFEAFPR
jgi:serine/threonine-protein kinase